MGCRMLCAEIQRERHSHLGPHLTPDQRMLVAARIAAVTLFAGRFGVWDAPDWGDAPAEDVTVDALTGGQEGSGPDSFHVTARDIDETLSTALFRLSRDHEFAWAHRSFEEYLAALYVNEHKMVPQQIFSLLFHPDGHLIPQLAGVGVWMVGSNQAVFDRIAKSDAEVLVRVDISAVPAEAKREVIRSLLTERCEWDVVNGIKPGMLGQMRYECIDQQLRPYLENSRDHRTVQRVLAVMLAGACSVNTLTNHLVSIVENEQEEEVLRREAVEALGLINDENALHRLKEVLASELPLPARLRTVLLITLWPNTVTSSDIVEVAQRFGPEASSTSFEYIVGYRIGPSLDAAALAAVLSEAAEKLEMGQASAGVRVLSRSLLRRAWSLLDGPLVRSAVARLLYYYLRLDHAGDHGVSALADRDDWLAAQEKRRRLLAALVPLLQGDRPDAFMLAIGTHPFVTRADFTWTLDRLSEAEGGTERQVWTRLLWSIFDFRELEQLRSIAALWRDHTELRDVFGDLIMDGESAEDVQLRLFAAQEQHLREFADPNVSPALDPPPKERVLIRLADLEAGNPAGWWDVNLQMTLNPTSTHYGNEDESDLMSLPGWDDADEETRLRMIRGAALYLEIGDPSETEWLGTNSFYRPASAGYRAFRLLASQQPQFLDDLSASLWAKWAAAIVAYPDIATEDQTVQAQLVCAAYQEAPESVLRGLEMRLQMEIREGWRPMAQRLVAGCWDKQVERTLVRICGNPGVQPEQFEVLVADFLDHGSSEAQEMLLRIVRTGNPDDAQEPRYQSAVQIVLSHITPALWDDVWPLLRSHPELADRCITRAAFGSSLVVPNFGERLDPDHAAEFCEWMLRTYPRHDDPVVEGVHSVSAREAIGRWRDSTIAALAARGTEESLQALRRLADSFPTDEGLHLQVLSAEGAFRAQSWEPPEPQEIIALGQNAQRRIVHTPDQLLDVLIESLSRLEDKLHGKPPAVQFLWNDLGNGFYRPKLEEDFSDFVKVHLANDLCGRGIVINREVQLKQSLGGSGGEQTDILVEAISRGVQEVEPQTLSVVLECKGSWNRGVESAMKSQLVDRYLTSSQYRHGLYLVGWYACSQWEPHDDKRKRTPKYGIAEARRRFADTAAQLRTGQVTVRSVVLNTALD